ncbi:MAG: hypothetical protein QMC81_02965 [Thermoanaerobacterales bacterium]|nr:hypothetical protein [Thermoanaerobacterales bacterium]
MIESLLTGAVAGGIGVTAAVLTWSLTAAARPRFEGMRVPSVPVHHKWDASDRAAAVAGMAGLAGGMILTWGSSAMGYAGVFAGLALAVGAKVVFRWRLNAQKVVRQKEIVVLFETVELYMRAGMPLHHALAAARMLTPSLRRAVGEALTYWPGGPAKALEVLREKIDLPEADILASLLLQIEQAGIDNLEGIVRREGKRLEQLRDAADRARINIRPLYLVLFRALPLVACLGMIGGALFMHVRDVLQAAGLWG